MPFYWGCFIFLISYIWIDRICIVHNAATAWDGLHWTCSITCNDWKIICPSSFVPFVNLSFVSETARVLGVHLYIRNIPGLHFTLHSASTLDSIYNSHPRKTRKQRGSTVGFARDEPTRVEKLQRTSALCRCTLRENKTSKQGKNICTIVWVFESDFCTPVYLTLVTFTHQHGGNKLYYGKLRCHIRLLSAYWIKIIFSKQRLY